MLQLIQVASNHERRHRQQHRHLVQYELTEAGVRDVFKRPGVGTET